jgi:hypothetical protein
LKCSPQRSPWRPTLQPQSTDPGVLRFRLETAIVSKRTSAVSDLGLMQSGNKPSDGGRLMLSDQEKDLIIGTKANASKFIKRYLGSHEIINGGGRWCIWVEDAQIDEASEIEPFATRFDEVAKLRMEGGKQSNDNAATPHRFVFAPHNDCPAIAVPNHSSERRQYLPCDLTDYSVVVSNAASVIYDAPLWNMAIIVSRLHLTWIATVCGKLETRYRYSNTLGWNTFPVPLLTEQNKADLTTCAENILLGTSRNLCGGLS